MRSTAGPDSQALAGRAVSMEVMNTLTLAAQPRPTYLDTLLHDLVMQLCVLPRDAYSLHDREQLPAPLKKITRMATHVGQSWQYWTDGRDRHWLFVAEMPSTRGAPVLLLDQYNEAGDLRGSIRWQCGEDDQWRRRPF